MNVIAGSHEWAKQNGYRIERRGAILWVVIDEEDAGSVVCSGKTHADAVRALIANRFSDAA